MNKRQRKKMAAPIVILCILVLYFSGFISICVWFPIPTIFRVLGIVIPLAVLGVVIFVVIERIREIRSGEEDDLSQY